MQLLELPNLGGYEQRAGDTFGAADTVRPQNGVISAHAVRKGLYIDNIRPCMSIAVPQARLSL